MTHWQFFSNRYYYNFFLQGLIILINTFKKLFRVMGIPVLRSMSALLRNTTVTLKLLVRIQSVLTFAPVKTDFSDRESPAPMRTSVEILRFAQEIIWGVSIHMVLISAYARMVSSRMEINVFKQLLQEKFFKSRYLWN